MGGLFGHRPWELAGVFGCLGGSFRGYGGFFGRRPWELGGSFWCLGCSFCGYRGGGFGHRSLGRLGCSFRGYWGCFWSSPLGMCFGAWVWVQFGVVSGGFSPLSSSVIALF